MAIHTIFPIRSTSAIVSKLPAGEDGGGTEPSVFRLVETQYLGPPKVEGIEAQVLNKRMKNRDKIKPEKADISCTKDSTIL